jgi:DNA gyrase subunit A
VGGIIGINIDDGDRLLSVRETDGQKDILLATAKGFSIRFPESEVRTVGRASYGVRGLVLRPGDRLVAMEELDPHGQVLTVTERGYGKRTPVEDYRRQGRGGLGIINLKVTPKTGEVVGVRYVTPDEGLMLITQEGMIIRINVSGVRVVGRSTMGVKLMNLSADDRLVSIAKVEREEEALVEGEGGDGATLLGAGEIEPELELEAVDEMGDLDAGLDELTDLDDDDDDGGEGGPDETVH